MTVIRTNLSGSELSELSKSPCVGSMHFMKNGDVRLSLFEEDDDISFHDRSALIITSEFLMHALERDDWMLEFLNSMNKNLKDLEQKSIRKNLRVIDGGLTGSAKATKHN